MAVHENMDDAPRDRPILAFGRYAWESFTAKYDAQKEGWLVVQWNPDVIYDDDADEYKGGFVSITANPYKDYMVATRWMELPL